MEVILNNELIFEYNQTIHPADPYELARMNAIQAFSGWIRQQLIILSVIIILLNLVFMVFHRQIAAAAAEHLNIKKAWIYDIVFGVNVAFTGMLLYVIFRS